MNRRGFGPTAWLLDEVDDPAALARGIDLLSGAVGIIDVVPAESTVLVTCERTQWEHVGVMLDGVEPRPATAETDQELIIDVVYDGEDLADVAASCGLGVDEVVRRHLAGRYSVAFCGFSPGFGYLRGLDPELHLPRRDIPRTSVPAGAVAIAAGYCAVYPAASPGGWHLIGSSEAVLWNSGAEPPSPMQPGRSVRFRQSVR